MAAEPGVADPGTARRHAREIGSPALPVNRHNTKLTSRASAAGILLITPSDPNPLQHKAQREHK